METGPLDPKVGLDRFATMDEIQAALTFLPDFFLPCETDNLLEVPSDRGGYVLISNETDAVSVISLFEKIDTTAN